MVITVHLLVSSRIVFCITLSVSVSIEAVASSRTSILRFCSNARAKHTSCRCPTLQFSPSSATTYIFPKLQFTSIKKISS
ncbi:hypothetical protein Hanom_Chr12g01109011 [Helianthus anomalus]